MRFSITKEFSASVERTARVLEVAEAFGLGLNDKKFTVYKNLEFEIDEGDVVYITGQSGSGKSILLREIAERLKRFGLTIGNIEDVPLAEMPLVDQIGKTTNEALYYLAMAGVNDAYLFIRKPSELSDGQRYRFKLAKLIEANTDVWVADEFGAVLDRTTAKVIAFNMQKLARKNKRTLLVATTHTDLGQELGPDLTINKHFRDKVEIVKIEDPNVAI